MEIYNQVLKVFKNPYFINTKLLNGLDRTMVYRKIKEVDQDIQYIPTQNITELRHLHLGGATVVAQLLKITDRL